MLFCNPSVRLTDISLTHTGLLDEGSIRLDDVSPNLSVNSEIVEQALATLLEKPVDKELSPSQSLSQVRPSWNSELSPSRPLSQVRPSWNSDVGEDVVETSWSSHDTENPTPHLYLQPLPPTTPRQSNRLKSVLTEQLYSGSGEESGEENTTDLGEEGGEENTTEVGDDGGDEKMTDSGDEGGG